MIRRLIYWRHVHVLRLITVRLCVSPLRLVLRAIPLSLELFLVEVNVVLLDMDDRLPKEIVCFSDERGRDFRCAVCARDCFAEPDERLELTYGDAVRVSPEPGCVVLTEEQEIGLRFYDGLCRLPPFWQILTALQISIPACPAQRPKRYST